MADDDESNLDRFGWSSGQLCYIDDDGNKVRIGEITPQDQAMIDKLTAERAARQQAADRRPKKRHIHIHRR
jgi:hypothetical protein